MKYRLFDELDKAQPKRADRVRHAFRSFHKRAFRPINFNKIVLIDDDLSAYYEYLVAILQVIAVLKGQPYHQHCPFQLDLWIIPRNVKNVVYDGGGLDSGDEDDGDDPEDDEKKEAHPEDGGNGQDDVDKDCIGDLEERLKGMGWKYTKCEHPDSDGADAKQLTLKRKMEHQLRTLLADRRKQRIIVYIDRRNPKRVDIGKESVDIWADSIYFVQPLDEQFSQIPDGHSPETLFWASTQCLLPRADGRHFGCKHPFNGYQFTLSWHVESADLTRCYWFCGHWGTRFFPAWYVTGAHIQCLQLSTMRDCVFHVCCLGTRSGYGQPFLSRKGPMIQRKWKKIKN